MTNLYDEPTEICPYCQDQMYAEFVDIGVGSVQGSPYHCQSCGASEIGPELYDWYYKDRNGHTLLLTAKRIYNPYTKTKMRGFGKRVLKPGHPFSQTELETGYYQAQVSPYANTIDGNLVDLDVAKAAYELGVLDDKPFTSGGIHHDPSK